MKPRPVISLAMPRAVGVQARAELADVQLVDDPDPAELAERLDAQLPQGMSWCRREPAEGRTAAARVEATATGWRWTTTSTGRARCARSRRPRAARWCEPPPARPIGGRRQAVLLEHRARAGTAADGASDDRSRHRTPGGNCTGGRRPHRPRPRTSSGWCAPHLPSRPAGGSTHLTLISNDNKDDPDLGRPVRAAGGSGRRGADRRGAHRAARRGIAGRKHLQGQDRQRPARHGGRLRRPRPAPQRVPATWTTSSSPAWTRSRAAGARSTSS